MGHETRKLPTRPGWWLARIGDGEPFCSRVWIQGMDNAMIATDAEGGHRLVSAWTDAAWLAPIPGPEVCAAVAEYGAAVLAADGAPDESSLTSFLARSAADRALRDAIRAERDGAA